MLIIILMTLGGEPESHMLVRPTPAPCNAEIANQVALTLRAGRGDIQTDFLFWCAELETMKCDPKGCA